MEFQFIGKQKFLRKDLSLSGVANAELMAVFGYGAAGARNTALFDHRRDRFV